MSHAPTSKAASERPTLCIHPGKGQLPKVNLPFQAASDAFWNSALDCIKDAKSDTVGRKFLIQEIKETFLMPQRCKSGWLEYMRHIEQEAIPYR